MGRIKSLGNSYNQLGNHMKESCWNLISQPPSNIWMIMALHYDQLRALQPKLPK